MSFSDSRITGAVDADRRAVARAVLDMAQHRRRHVAPSWDEGGKPPRRAADDKQVNVIGARHDRDARIQFALVPARQVAVVDAAVAVVESQLSEQITCVHEYVVAVIVPGPALG